jgi:hypothetical protein
MAQLTADHEIGLKGAAPDRITEPRRGEQHNCASVTEEEGRRQVGIIKVLRRLLQSNQQRQGLPDGL